MRRIVGLPSIAVLLLGCATDPAPVTPPVAPASTTPPTPAPTKPGARAPAHQPVGQVLPVGVGPIEQLQFAREFRYIGGQRFVLGKSADAEQHFFVVPGEPGAIRRLYWIQFEQLLPGVGTEYDYSADGVLMVGAVPFRRNLRRWDTPPAPDSDRAAMYAFLERKGYRIPAGAVRIRLVHVPQNNPREELMIVYAETPDPAAAAPPSEDDVERGALEGLHVVAAAPEPPKKESRVRSSPVARRRVPAQP